MSATPIDDSPHATAVHITLQPGHPLEKNATPVDVFFYVLGGHCGISGVRVRSHMG